MIQFRCERCGERFPLSEVRDGWEYGDSLICEKCWQKEPEHDGGDK
jgi:formylmethanofuran dehydrogenase subunit E